MVYQQPSDGPELLGETHGTQERYRRELIALVALADVGIALQPEADAVIAACGAEGVVPDGVGSALGRVSHSYSLVSQQAREMGEVDGRLTPLLDELRQLLSYHQHMLRDAGDMAFSAERHPATEPFRRELAGGLGLQAARLADLGDTLRGLLANAN